MAHASVWTPRHGNKLWPRPSGFQKHSFSPKIGGAYSAPPPPPSRKKAPPPKAGPMPVETLEDHAAELRAEANRLEAAGTRQPNLRIQLGLLLLSKEDFIKKILKDWDTKGKGEFLRAEFRLNLRNTGVMATSAEADDLFDSWDDDKGGTLDLKELRAALTATQEAAKKWKDTPDPNQDRARALRERAQLADEAAAATAQADEIENELEEHMRELEGRADVRLGNLLFRRRIKPGAVVTQWAKSKGEHAGELSKTEFREACIKLGLQTTGPNPTTHADIDAVFDTFDADGGGYLDADEAKDMIKGLQSIAEDAERERWSKTRQAQKIRANASKKAKEAMAPMPSQAAVVPPPENDPPKEAAPKKGKKAKKKELPADGLSPIGEDAAVTPVTVARLPVSAMVQSVKGGIAALSDRLFATDRTKKAMQENVLKAAGRISNLQMIRAWNTWKGMRDEVNFKLDQVKSSIKRLLNPWLLKGWLTWASWYDDRVNALDLLRRALHHWTMGSVIVSFQTWCEGHEERMAELERRRKARNALNRFKHPQLVESFTEWRKQQRLGAMERQMRGIRGPAAPSLCEALAKCCAPAST